MGFTSGSASFVRYFMPAARPKAVTDEFIKAVNDHAFGRHGSGGEENEQLGWITHRHLFDTDVTGDKIALGRYVQMAMRIEKVAVPASLFRSYIRMEEDAALEASGREFLGKFEKKKARDAAKRRVDAEVRAGGHKRTAAYPMLMDLDRRLLLFASGSDAVNERLVDLFKATFHATIERGTPLKAAKRLLGGGDDAPSLDELRPVHLIKPARHGGDDDEESFEDGGYVGREFLSWLWYKSDTGEAEFLLKRGAGGESAGANAAPRVAVMIDKTLRLVCDFQQTGSVVITRDGVAQSIEARAALAVGKQPTRMGLVLGAPTGEYSLALDGPRFAVSGLSMNLQEKAKSAQEKLEARYDGIFDAVDMLDGLYEQFIRLRISDNWNKELRAMMAWARDKGAPAATSAS